MVRALLFFLVTVLAGLFALINWDVFTAPAPLSLVFTTVQAPLGLIMLGVCAFLCVLFTVWVIAMQATALAESRRQTKELQAQRDLAERVEISRFTDLRSELMVRLDRLQNEALIAIDQHAGSMSAQLGQLEDRLERERLLAPTGR